MPPRLAAAQLLSCPCCGASLAISAVSDPRPRPPAPPPRPRPCPRSAARAPLSRWQALGLTVVGQRVEPVTIAAAYRRLFGCEPARDASKVATRAYSRRELVLLKVVAPAQGEVIR